jgi:hypothetical protein
MLDFKFQYMNNVINNYYSYGFSSLNLYDKYHIILMIVDYLSCNFCLNLGNFVKTLHLPNKMFISSPIIGLKINKFLVPKLYDLSLCVIQRNRLYYPNNNYYNLKILRSKDLYTIHDKNNIMFEYFRNVYYHHPKDLIRLLIDRYTLVRDRQHIYTQYSDNEESEDEDEDTSEYESED